MVTMKRSSYASIIQLLEYKRTAMRASIVFDLEWASPACFKLLGVLLIQHHEVMNVMNHLSYTFIVAEGLLVFVSIRCSGDAVMNF